jgi:hypothetical protein
MKLTFFEIGLFVAVPLLAVAVTVGDSVALVRAADGLAIRWLAVLTYTVFSFWVMWRKSRPHPHFKFMSAQGVAVGWTRDIFRVDRDAFEALIEEYLTKAETVFPGARAAVNGSTVIFREPVWYYRTKPVEGLQDHSILSVGWRPNLVETALRHEIGHRILQVLVGDPPEEAAHQILKDNGLL